VKTKRVIPAFKTEAEEAEWWHRNRAGLDEDFLEAVKKGTLKRLDPATLKEHLAASKSRVAAIEAGIQAADEGRLTGSDEVRKLVKTWTSASSRANPR
jgi:predicted transcriptional regulator